MIEPVITHAGFDLEDLSVSRAGRREIVRIIIDGDGGVSLDAVATVSRAVSVALDAAEGSGRLVTAGEYTLEVSSPGVDRPLAQPRHWRRRIGRLVKVKAGARQVTARVLAADEVGVTLDDGGQPLVVPYTDLGPGHVQLDFTGVAELGNTDDDDEEGEDEA